MTYLHSFQQYAAKGAFRPSLRCTSSSKIRRWKGEELIELYIEDFYTGDCIVEIDEEFCEPRYFISLNYEVIYLDGIEEKK